MKLKFKDQEFNEHMRLTLLASLIGIVAGLASIVFKLMIQFFQNLFWRAPSIISAVASQPWYITILIPAAGGLLITPLIYYGAREAKGHGVPEIMEASVLKGGHIRGRVAVIKAIASSICIGSGGSTGREGPIVQISASLASSLGKLFRIKEKGMRTLVAAGAGAGIGATFNAPIAGALFAVEVILGDFGILAFSPIIVASVMSTLTSRFLTGNFSAFTVPKYSLISIWEIGPYIILGIVSGLVAILFIEALYFFEATFDKLRVHPLTKPIMGGLMVGIIGLGLPQVLGVSYDAMDAGLQNQIGFWLAFILVFAKILSTSLTLGSGGSGGIFAPSLFLGAMTGNLVGSAFHSAFPNSISNPGAFSLVGMGAVVAAATHAPITAIVIIFELTDDYKIILPLMLSCIIASFLSVGIHKDSIYTMKLRQRGILLKKGQNINVLRSMKVHDFISQDHQVFLNTERVGEIINQAIGGKHHTFQIINSENKHIGYFSLNQLKNIIMEKEVLGSAVIAQDLANQDIRIDHNDNLEKAMNIFGATDVAEIAVLKEKVFMGVIKRKDVIEAYNHEISKIEATSGILKKFENTDLTKACEIGSGYKIMEIKAPPAFFNKTLKQLNLKALYRIDILLIKRKYPPQSIPIPSADENIKQGDILIIAGQEDCFIKIMNNDLF